MQKLLPQEIDYILIQADNTAIAPGPLHVDLAREMSLIANIESKEARPSIAYLSNQFDAPWIMAEVAMTSRNSSRKFQRLQCHNRLIT